MCEYDNLLVTLRYKEFCKITIIFVVLFAIKYAMKSGMVDNGKFLAKVGCKCTDRVKYLRTWFSN